MASMRSVDYGHFSCTGFSHDLRVEMWIQFHASHVNIVVFRGTGGMRLC